jgi:hypothetical protein
MKGASDVPAFLYLNNYGIERLDIPAGAGAGHIPRGTEPADGD